MEQFGTLLRKLRKELNFSQQKLADEIGEGITRENIRCYEENYSWPSYPKLKIICEYFNLDITEIRKEQQAKKEQQYDEQGIGENNFGRRLQRLRAELGLTQLQMSAEFGLPRHAVNCYENNVSFPTYKRLKIICAYFNLDIKEILLIRHWEKHPQTEE